MKHGFLDKYAGRESPVHALDARAKVVVFLVLVIASATTPPEHVCAFALYAAIPLGPPSNPWRHFYRPEPI